MKDMFILNSSRVHVSVRDLAHDVQQLYIVYKSHASLTFLISKTINLRLY